MNLLVCLADANDACSFYRGHGPFSGLRKKYGYSVQFSQTPSIGDLRSADVVFLLRPCTEGTKKIARFCSDYGIPLWVDFDDDLFNLPTDNPSYEFYRKGDVQATMELLIKEAKVVTVSTLDLKTKFSKVNSNTIVVPNAYDPVLSRFRIEKPNKPNVVFWRGTGTHNRDVYSVKDQIIEASKECGEALFTFLGADPFFVTEHIRSTKFPFLDIISYHKAIQEIRPSIFIVPLADNTFNKAKSQIAAYEAAYCGAVTIAPDWEQWKSIPGVTTYDTAQTFGRVLVNLLKADQQTRSDLSKLSWDYISSNLCLDEVNKIRAEIIKSF